jgi:hypothetical protein
LLVSGQETIMAKTVVGLFETDRKLLAEVLDDLGKKLIPPENVSTLRTQSSSVLEDAGKGALVGGFAGLAIGAAALLIPGIGWVAVAGPVVNMLVGAAAGATAGGLIGALINKEVPEEHAHFFAEGLRRGGTLVIINVRNDEEARKAEDVMLQNGAIDIRERRAQWMYEGWQGHFEAKPDEAPLTEQDAHVPLAAVCVYDVIKMPVYRGLERRQAAKPYSGMERRAA